MRKFYSGVFLLIMAFVFGQISYTVTPNPFNETDQITLTVREIRSMKLLGAFQIMQFIFGPGHWILIFKMIRIVLLTDNGEIQTMRTSWFTTAQQILIL